MFGLFRSRPKFNGAVDTKLNNEYQINTRREPFPGPAAYLKLLDAAWSAKMTEDEASMYVASLFFCGLLKAGYDDAAKSLFERIMSVGEFGLSHGLISQTTHQRLVVAMLEAIEEPAREGR